MAKVRYRLFEIFGKDPNAVTLNSVEERQPYLQDNADNVKDPGDPGHQSMLSVVSVSKEYYLKGRPILAVENVSFEVNEGELCVLLGPSGSGKSTLLRMIAGLLPVSSGDIILSGQPVQGPGRERGMVFQSYTSFPWLTVQENVEYGLRINGASAKECRDIASYFIDRVKLTPFRYAYPDQLSGGMRQRVAIARTLANGPEILLMDEPFGALDAETRWQMQELLLDIVRNENVTALIVTHDVQEAIFLADHIVFLSSHPGTVRERIVVSTHQSPHQSTSQSPHQSTHQSTHNPTHQSPHNPTHQSTHNSTAPPTQLPQNAPPTQLPQNREDMFETADYINLEKKIMKMMREEAYGSIL